MNHLGELSFSFLLEVRQNNDARNIDCCAIKTCANRAAESYENSECSAVSGGRACMRPRITLTSAAFCLVGIPQSEQHQFPQMSKHKNDYFALAITITTKYCLDAGWL